VAEKMTKTKAMTYIPIGLRNIGVYYPDLVVTSKEIAEKSGIPENVIREKFGIWSIRKALPDENVSDLCVKAAKNCIQGILEPEELNLIIYHGSEFRDYNLYNCAAHIQHKLGAKNAVAFQMSILCASSPLALQVAKSMMLTQSDLKNVLLVTGSRESDLVDFRNNRARFMFNFADGAAACLLQRNYNRNELLETKIITDGSFATDVAVYGVGSVGYHTSTSIERDFLKTEEAKANGEQVGYFGLDSADPLSMKERLDAVSMANFINVISGAAEKSGYSTKDIKFLAPIFMKSSILNNILEQLNLNINQSFVLRDFGHIQSADAYISLYEGLKLDRVQEDDLVIMLGAGIGYSWAATAIKWGFS
jgi:3-oxoacyl-[acyl-carrier-protein] synthase-3